MPQQNDLSRSLTPFEHTTTLVAVIELSKLSWLIAGTIPGIERQPPYNTGCYKKQDYPMS
jgi:transposase